MKKRILMLATGGTIASRESGQGLAPAITSEELLGYVPGIGELCRVETVQLMNLDSTNVGPSHWLSMARAIEAHYRDYDGFVVTHGTDTMAYTAAALSYLIQRSPKPIVLTGSQRSICMENTDARMNLYNAFLYAAAEGSRGVSLVFDGKVISGTRARKERTKSFNAFSSVDYPELAIIRDGRLIRYLAEQGRPGVFPPLRRAGAAAHPDPGDGGGRPFRPAGQLSGGDPSKLRGGRCARRRQRPLCPGYGGLAAGGENHCDDDPGAL